MPTIDPTLSPVSADELAADAPDAADAPVLKQAEQAGKTRENPVEGGLTTLPPD